MRWNRCTRGAAGLWGAVFLLCPSAAFAGDEFATDRPDFTEASSTVARGRFQIESGLTWTDGPGGGGLLNLPETLLRWGVADRSELRLGLPDFLRERGGRRGFSDLYLGMKQEVLQRGGFQLAALPALSLPTGTGGNSSGSVDPELVLAWSQEVGGPYSLGGGLGFFWRGPAQRFAFSGTLVVGRELGGPWGTFLEYAVEQPRGARAAHLLHHGYTYAVGRNAQADLHFGVGLSRAAPDFFVGAGFAQRF